MAERETPLEIPRDGLDVEDLLREPPQFVVFLHNDNYTTMEFVVEVLESIFHKRPSEAMRIMLHVHKQGRGTAGTYTREIAETRIDRVHSLARQRGFPLRCSMEQA